MYHEEIAVRIVQELSVVDFLTPYEQKERISSILYDYDIQRKETSLVLANDIPEKMALFIGSKKVDGISETTLRSYFYQLKLFSEFVNKQVEEIDAMDIRRYLLYREKEGIGKSTIATIVWILKSFFSWMLMEEIITKNPMMKIKTPKSQKVGKDRLTLEELEIIRVNCTTDRQLAMLWTFYSTGCRLSELQEANVSDIDWVAMSLKVIGKGNKERTVYINQKAKVYLQIYLKNRKDNNPALFVNERRPYNRLSRRAIQREFERMGQQANIQKKVHPHAMRHAMATNMINSGATITGIQQILGHSNLTTTQIYSQLSQSNIKHEFEKFGN